MKITVTGSLGNISRRLAMKLVAKGHEVTIISHNPEKAAAIEALGAIPAIGSVEDEVFLSDAFTGADAVYLMVPPNAKSEDLKAGMKAMAQKYAYAVQRAGVQHIICLSGIGAETPEGHGVSSALHYLEKGLADVLPDVNILFLRPGMFYTNHNGSVGMIQRMGFMGNNFDADKTIMMSNPHDIADAAAEALNGLLFSGKQIQYVVSDELTGGELAQILGGALGKPNLPWVVFTDDQLKQGILQGGFSQHMADNFAEMGRAIGEGIIWNDYRANKVNNFGGRKFSEFAKELAAMYNK